MKHYLYFATVFSVFAVLMLLASVVQGEPFVPSSDAQILERLPITTKKTQKLRQTLAQKPSDLQQALALARSYLEIGRSQADPRYYGYIQAILQPWWQQPRPPTEVLLLRATLRQNRHDFAGALQDLEQILAVQPRNAQAWLTQAVILTVLGDHKQALASCLPLRLLSSEQMTNACIANAASLSGQAEASYHLLLDTAQNGAPPQEQLWTLTLLAEIAVRLNKVQAAEQHFQQALALGLRDVYLLSAYADFLLDQDRPEDVQTLLKDDIRPDGLLLRLALAEQRLGAESDIHLQDLHGRFNAARLRGENQHLGAEARYTLHLLQQPVAALELAQANWAVQREPRDARWLLEAALAAQ